jgi:hypothetical protein
MLKIIDLRASKELESKEMTGVRGGTSFIPPVFPSVDFSTGITNKVADVGQMFQLGLAQGNTGAVTNNQAIAGGNGTGLAPVWQDQHQYNDLRVSEIGNVHVS